MKRIAPLTVTLKPSRRLLVIQSAAHLIAGLSVLVATIPPWLAVLLLLGLGASLAHMRKSSDISALVLRGDGRLEKVGADGTAKELGLHPHTTVLPFLIVLLYREEGRSGSLVLLVDSMSDDDFRQIRVWLRWRAETLSPAGVDAAPSPGRGAGSPDNPG